MLGDEASAKKAKEFKEINDRDVDTSDTFTSMVNEDQISDDDLECFIKKFL